MAEPGELIAVRTEVVLDVLIASMHEEAARRVAADGPAGAEGAGYHARAVERERFAPARAPMPWLEELLAAHDGAVAAVAAELAAAEPEERPDPESGAASWRVPGPGGHVRHYLALRAGDKRAWMRGYFTRCCEEAAGGTGAGPGD